MFCFLDVFFFQVCFSFRYVFFRYVFFLHIFLNIFFFKNVLQIFFFKTVELNMIVSYLPFF
jgi:hypothetical protein